MTRHGKNCTAGTVYTYHEKQKDSKASGYGSNKLRLGKDSIKGFDCCCLTLQPCKEPVVTPDGYLFEREAILEYMVHQKREIARKLKEYERQRVRLHREEKELQKAAEEARLQKFLSTESPSAVMQQASSAQGRNVDTNTDVGNFGAGGVAPAQATAGASTSSSLATSSSGGRPDTVSNTGTDTLAKQLPSFWIPNLTPEAKPTEVKKPEEKVRCPMSGRTLKLKDLIPVHFTPIADKDVNRSLGSKQDRYVCAVSNDVLGDAVPIVVLRTSGSVVTEECFEKIIKHDMIDPINSKRMTEKDIIRLGKGSSGFAGSGIQLQAKQDRPAMMAT